MFTACLLGRKSFHEFLDFIKNDGSVDTIPAEIFYRLSNLSSLKPKYKDYELLKKLFMDNLEKFSHFAKYNFMTELETAWVMSTGDPDRPKRDSEERFEIYKYEFDNRLFSSVPGGLMRSHFYRSMLMSAIAERKIEWIEQFIETGTPFLMRASQENMRNYANAHFMLSKKRI
ncbi:hypothetical protein BH10BAC5_BH10BAC5_20300 [soil metagenome]